MILLRKAWAFVAPWLGGVLLRSLPWLTPLGAMLKAWRGVLIALSLVAIFAAGWWVANPTEHLTVEEAQQLCEDANLRAELAAVRQALAEAQETLRRRSIAIEMAEREIEALREEREALRAAAPDPNAPVFDADDPWLRTGATR